jgi:hypothetical protein
VNPRIPRSQPSARRASRRLGAGPAVDGGRGDRPYRPAGEHDRGRLGRHRSPSARRSATPARRYRAVVSATRRSCATLQARPAAAAVACIRVTPRHGGWDIDLLRGRSIPGEALAGLRRDCDDTRARPCSGAGIAARRWSTRAPACATRCGPVGLPAALGGSVAPGKSSTSCSRTSISTMRAHVYRNGRATSPQTRRRARAWPPSISPVEGRRSGPGIGGAPARRAIGARRSRTAPGARACAPLRSARAGHIALEVAGRRRRAPSAPGGCDHHRSHVVHPSGITPTTGSPRSPWHGAARGGRGRGGAARPHIEVPGRVELGGTAIWRDHPA